MSDLRLSELTLFCTELPENCIYLNQSEPSNFSMYIIIAKISCCNLLLSMQKVPNL